MKSSELDIIFQQAVKDHGATNLSDKDYEIRMMHGVRIQRYKSTQEVKIFNPRGKNYYEELTKEEYKIFQGGWRKGVYNLVLQVYRNRLERIEKKIAEEVNLKRSQASLKGFRERRLNIMNKYYKVTQKLNQLK